MIALRISEKKKNIYIHCLTVDNIKLINKSHDLERFKHIENVMLIPSLDAIKGLFMIFDYSYDEIIKLFLNCSVEGNLDLLKWLYNYIDIDVTKNIKHNFIGDYYYDMSLLKYNYYKYKTIKQETVLTCLYRSAILYDNINIVNWIKNNIPLYYSVSQS